jgi:methyl-accepting chemotaxis protein
MASVTEGFLEARQLAAEFLQKRDEKLIERHQAILARLAENLDAVEGLIAPLSADDPIKRGEALRSGINMYATRFNNVVSAERLIGLNENQGLQGKLREAVHTVEKRLAEFDQPRLAVLMLMMRRHEKDFMLRRDQKYAGELKKAAAEFSKSLAAAEIASALTAEITLKLEKYQNEFSAWVDTAQQVAGYDATMMKTFRGLEPLIVEVGQGVERLYKEADMAEAATRDSVRTWMLTAFALAVVLVCGLSLLIGRSISTALSAMARAMTRLAGGDFVVVIPSHARRDEIGEMADAVQVFKTNMIETERLRAEQLEIEQRQLQQRKADMHKLADAFEGAVGEIVEGVSSAATELEASANILTTTAGRARELATAVAAASEEASTNVQSVSSASEEMTSSVNEISRQVQESSRVANEAVVQARKTNDRVGELSKAAARIGDVVELINTIAGQTNLLALNATIEAARAGEAGRGFAVVASEVKALAEQTAKATGEISQQISGIQAATQDSVGAIKEIGDTIGRMSEISSTIAAAVEEQGAASQEISRNIQHAAEGTSHVSSNITDVQRGASETGSASAQVHSAAKSLSSESNRLKLEVGKFLNSVRAACPSNGWAPRAG